MRPPGWLTHDGSCGETTGRMLHWKAATGSRSGRWPWRPARRPGEAEQAEHDAAPEVLSVGRQSEPVPGAASQLPALRYPSPAAPADLAVPGPRCSPRWPRDDGARPEAARGRPAVAWP